MSLVNSVFEINQHSFQQDSVLLATLPYCIASYSTLKLIFNSASEWSRCISNLERKGFIEKRKLKIKSSFRSYDYKYIVLTTQGLLYISTKYSELYQWLRYVAIYLEENPEQKVNTRATQGNREIYRTLQRQSAHLFWSLAGANTMYERMETNPQILANTIKLSKATPSAYTPNILSQAMLYVEEQSAEPGTQLENSEPGTQFSFFDTREILTLESAYTTQKNTNDINGNREPKLSPTGSTDSVLFQNNHIGLIVGSTQDYVTYETNRHGIRWDSHLVKRNSRVLNNQFIAAGTTQYIDIPTSGYASILLCDNIQQLKFAYTDKRNQRARLGTRLGQNAASMHMIPMCDEGIELANGLCTVANYDNAWGREASENIGNLEWEPVNVRFPFVCNGIKCAVGLSMDAKKLQYCEDEMIGYGRESVGIVCWDWEAEYIRAALPDARIFMIDASRYDAIEYDREPG